ncbi:hypothetical protein MCETHM1_01334 [Flavobacteriaceae bacterium]|jgi:hypothetical protein
MKKLVKKLIFCLTKTTHKSKKYAFKIKRLQVKTTRNIAIQNSQLSDFQY